MLSQRSLQMSSIFKYFCSAWMASTAIFWFTDPFLCIIQCTVVQYSIISYRVEQYRNIQRPFTVFLHFICCILQHCRYLLVCWLNFSLDSGMTDNTMNRSFLLLLPRTQPTRDHHSSTNQKPLCFQLSPPPMDSFFTIGLSTCFSASMQEFAYPLLWENYTHLCIAAAHK